jgi:hypothetical protein
MALKEPNMNNPWHTARGKRPLTFFSSERAEYISFGKNFSSGEILYSKRSFQYSSSYDVFL